MSPEITWPDDKRFAFTVFDDTDLATVSNVGPVYSFLNDLGVKTTKSVWPLSGSDTPILGGETCEDPHYLQWTLELQRQGFEIGYHGATYHTAPREQVIEAMERFQEAYGHYPRSMANHAHCAEGMYWGADRVSGVNRLAYHAMTRFRRVGSFRGHVAGDPLFWGDVCKENVRYVRNFTFADIDTLAACPAMPYRDPKRPYVNNWFASSEGSNVEVFNRCISESEQDRLEEAGSACIMYTHFASGFHDGNALDRRFRELMERLARKGGWFVPVTTLLDHIIDARGTIEISNRERSSLERRWLVSKSRVGHS